MSLLRIKQKTKLEQLIQKLTPPRKKNWNWGRQRGYTKQFSADFIEYIFPYLLSNAENEGLSIENLSFLDIGCGWAPLAIPFVIFNQSTNDLNKKNRYLGLDIREDAIQWLIHTYSDYPSVQFHWHKALKEVDYIGAEHSQSKTFAASSGEETKFKLPKNFSHNIQWSSSVFTHLTPEACLNALKSIKANAYVSNNIQFNTWLIIDDESRYSLEAEIADRKLPIDCGDFLTYSRRNPLVCTAFKIEAIERFYDRAGLEIIRIDRGAWRGHAYKNRANHYQDIVISRVRSK